MESSISKKQGIIFIDEARDTVNKLKKWYQEKIIDSGKSQDFEEKIDKTAKITKTVIGVTGAAATIALMFVPVDGPFGEIATALATPGLMALVDAAAEFRKKLAIEAKRGAEKTMGFGDQGVNKDVQGFTGYKDAINDAAQIRSGAEVLAQEFSNGRSR